MNALPRHIYFIGIGGIGMSALARYYHHAGHIVAGYDLTASPLTEKLEQEGIQVIYEDEVGQIPISFREEDEVLFVRTPAVPAENRIRSYAESAGRPCWKRSELLAHVADEKRSIAIAGTHGKTTTSAILAHVLYCSSQGCTAFVGGVMTGYERNLLLDADSPWLVLEADEFDRSFHRLQPEFAGVTAVDPDHLDIYGDEAQFRSAFLEFAHRIKPEGRLYHAVDIDLFDALPEARGYGIERGEVKVLNLNQVKGIHHFDLQCGEGRIIEKLSFPLPGRHNLENAVLASALALEAGISDDELRAGLASFRGVKRRFEVHWESATMAYVDDYAHHPREIKACIQAVRDRYPGRRLTAVFQPHLFSRTRDFIEGFAQALSGADELIILPIYPAREKPIPGVDAEQLLGRVSLTNKLVCEKAELLALLRGRELEVLLTMGAGDIDRLVPALSAQLEDQYSQDV